MSARTSRAGATLLLLVAGCSLQHSGLAVVSGTDADDLVAPDVPMDTVPDADGAMDDEVDAMDVVDASDADDAMDVVDASDATVDVPSIETGTGAGSRGQRCTEANACTDGSACIDLGGGVTVCGTCGTPGAPCCLGRVCKGSSAVTVNWNFVDYCVCEGSTADSPGGPCHVGSCPTGTQCSGLSGNCLACGDVAEPCCFGGGCSAGSCSFVQGSVNEAVCRAP